MGQHFDRRRSVYRALALLCLCQQCYGVHQVCQTVRLASVVPGSIDAERLLKPSTSYWGDDYCVAVFHFLDPAEIEEVLGDCGPERTGDVRAALGPIEAESAKVTAGGMSRGKRDPELAKKTGARDRDYGGIVAEHNIFAGNQRIGEINAEATRKVIVADSGRTDCACLTG